MNIHETYAVSGPGGFFLAIIAGIILSVGFQLMLTNLSAAFGISAAGNLENKGPSDVSGKARNKHFTVPGVIGLWSLATSSISLFFGALLAVKLSLVPGREAGMTLGLVIWAAFFSLMTYLEAKSILSLAGGIWHSALGGLRSALQTAKGVMEPSPEDRIEKAVRRSFHALRGEIADGINEAHLQKKIEPYLKRLEHKTPDLGRIGHEISKVLSSIEIRETESHSDEGVERRFRVYAGKMALAREAAEDTGQVIEKMTEGRADEDARRYREKIEQYLKSTRREELNPESIKKDIDRIIREPQSSKEVILNRIQRINAGTLVAVLTHRPDVSDDEANKIVENVKNAIRSVKEQVTSAAYSAVGETQSQAAMAVQTVKEQADGMKTKLEEKLSGYFNSLQRPEFDYERLKQDFVEMFTDPKATPRILKERLHMYNRDSIAALAASSGKISREDAEKIADKVEEARQAVLQKTEEVEHKVKEKAAEMQRAVLHQAECARRMAAAGAWWMFATAAVSAGAAALGGMLAGV